MDIPKTPSQQVLDYYPDAKPYKNDKVQWWTIATETQVLGAGPSKKAAWKSASRNINN